MNLPDEYRERVRQICDLYNTAEIDLKNVGRVKDVLIITGVNQLRYAGQHLVRALTADDAVEISDNLDAAERHCQRAIYDINDSAVQYFLQRIDELRRTQFPRVDFNAVIPDYGEIVSTIREARSMLHATRDGQHDRQQFYNDARRHVRDLTVASETLDEHRADLIRSSRIARRQVAVSWAAVGATLLVALIGGLNLFA